MKQLVPDWQFGFQLLLRLVIMFFCVAAGPALLLAAHLGLVAQGIRVPMFLVVAAQSFCVVVVSPCLLARYASYCGYCSAPAQAG